MKLNAGHTRSRSRSTSRSLNLQVELALHVVLVSFWIWSFAKGQLNINVHPTLQVQAEGVPTLFYCVFQAADLSNTISWKVNGSTLIQNPRPNITVEVDQNKTNTTIYKNKSVLTILALPEYNETIAQCVIIPSKNESDSVKLLVQGSLNSVKNLTFSMNSTSIHISWTAPFSLNLTTAEPDIQYCVDVYNVTGGGDLVESRCDITETFYTYTPDNPSPDHVFNFTVTPRSNVEGALNGTTSEPVQGYVIHRPAVIPSDVISYQINPQHLNATLQFPLAVIGTTPGRMPEEYSIHLLSIDDPNRPSDCSCPATSEVVNDDTIQLTLQWCPDCEIQRHRVYRFTIDATNSAGMSTSDPVVLNTHDVQHLTAAQGIDSQANNSDIDITWSYLSGSSQNGLFAIIYSPSEVHYVVVNGQGSTSVDVRIEGISQEQYSILVYDLEESLLPELWPAGVRIVNINSSQNASVSESELGNSGSRLRPPPILECQGNGMLCVNCSFSEPSINACVVILHSTHNTNNPLGKKLIIHSIERSIAYDCVEVSEDEYHVAVFGLLTTGLERVPAVKTVVNIQMVPNETATTGATTLQTTTSDSFPSPTVAVVIGIVGAVVVFAIVLLVIIITVFTLRKKKLSQTLEDFQDESPGYESVDVFRNTGVSHVQADITSDPESSRYQECPFDKPTTSNYENVELSGGNRHEHSRVPEYVIDGRADDQLLSPSDVPIASVGDSDPSYDVVENVLVRKPSTSHVVNSDATATEHQYSEIAGNICQGLHYAHVELKPSPSQQLEDSAIVLYSTVDKEKLVSDHEPTCTETNEQAPEQETCTSPPPPPPSAESLLSIIHPISDKWEELGEALGIDEDRLDEVFTNNDHNQLRLHHMLEYYFMNVHFKHTWEEVVQALKRIGETECADKIVRERKL